MFTWICPTCGREVPPAYDECPDCAAKAKNESAPQQQAAAAPPEAPAAPPPPSPAPVVPPPQAAPTQAPRGGLPTWLLSILFALLFIAVGVGIYWGVNYLRNRPQAPAGAAIPFENPSAKGKPHALQRYIEITGIRFVQDPQKRTEARFLVVNHSPDDISGLAGNVTIWGRTQKSDEEPVGTFVFKLSEIGPWESREAKAIVATRLRVYELPDWQNITADLQLTSP